MIESILSMGLLGVLLAMNMVAMTGSLKMHQEQREKREVMEYLSVLANEIEQDQPCTALFNTHFPPPRNLNDLMNPQAITMIPNPYNATRPLVEVNRPEMNGRLVITAITLQLAPRTPLIENQPRGYARLLMDYTYTNEKGGGFAGTKSVLLEFTIRPNSTTSFPFGLNGCMSYLTKRNKEITRLFCMMIGSPMPALGQVDGAQNGITDYQCLLEENFYVRKLACEFGTGFAYAGRYCDPVNPAATTDDSPAHPDLPQ